MGVECEKLNKRLAELIAEKTNQSYSHVITDIRRRLHFALLKATVIAVRGYRTLSTEYKPIGKGLRLRLGYRGARDDAEVMDVDMDIPFNLIPNENAYEA
jgi:hypothetical protein